MKIKSRTDKGDVTVVVAAMTVAYKMIHQTFTSRVTLDKANLKILVEYLDGPLKRLSNTWEFRAGEDGSCVIDFNVDFTFRSASLEALAGQYLDRAFRKMVAAFETRAEKVYGSRSSSATSAA